MNISVVTLSIRTKLFISLSGNSQPLWPRRSLYNVKIEKPNSITIKTCAVLRGFLLIMTGLWRPCLKKWTIYIPYRSFITKTIQNGACKLPEYLIVACSRSGTTGFTGSSVQREKLQILRPLRTVRILMSRDYSDECSPIAVSFGFSVGRQLHSYGHTYTIKSKLRFISDRSINSET